MRVFIEFYDQLFNFQEVITLGKYGEGKSENCSETNRDTTSQLVENQVSI